MFHSTKRSPFVPTPYTAATWNPFLFRNLSFWKWLHVATKRVQFSFNTTMYQQSDEISMGTPLGAALTNIFAGFQEARLFKVSNLPLYVDDAFVIFSSKSESRRFFNTIDQLHPALTFTCEFEHNNSLPFLDVLVECITFGLQKSICRKPTFTGSYTRWG